MFLDVSIFISVLDHDATEIRADTETGVNYVFHRNGNAAGFTPLLDKDGKPVVTKQELEGGRRQ